jgi:hypothetical protein
MILEPIGRHKGRQTFIGFMRFSIGYVEPNGLQAPGVFPPLIEPPSKLFSYFSSIFRLFVKYFFIKV